MISLTNQIRITSPYFLRRAIWLVLCFNGFLTGLTAQNKFIQGNVVNQFSREKIPFASISWKRSGKGVLTDSAGHFMISAGLSQDTLVVSYVGFNRLYIPVNLSEIRELNIELSQKQVEGVVVSAKYNKGLLWWKRIVQHKQDNNPYKFNTYSCQLYKKLELDLNNVNREKFEKIRLLKPFSFILDNIDSMSGSHPFLPVFMTESLSRYFFSTDPFKKREEIAAVQTNGIKSETVLHFIDGINQKINVYENAISLFGKDFISPFSNYGNSYYNYKAADTQYIGNQRYLHLLFSPKRQGERTFSGDCWIHSSTWAIKKIDLEISSTANINYVNRLNITQEFIQQNDSTWVFARDKLVADMSPMKKDRLSLIARQTTVYEHVQVDQPYIAEVLKKNTSPDQVIMDDSARMRTGDYWQAQRPEPLSVNEQKVYKMIDTLKSLPLFKKYTNTLKLLVDGRIDLGKIEIGPWYKFVSANQLEKFRVRFDIATTEKFSKSLRIHSYIAYGFGDWTLKGKMDVTYRFPGNRGYTVQASYLHDLDNGKSKYSDESISIDNVFSQLIRKPGIRQKFVMVDEIRAGITKEWDNKYSAQLFFSRSGYETFNPLPPKKLVSINEKDIINSELGIKLRYAPGEKKIVTHRKDVRIQGQHPVFEVRYMVGIPGVFKSGHRYQKINTLVSQRVSFPRWGKVEYQLYGGKIWSGPLPFVLLELHPGNETYYYSKQAFNLMNRFEYFSDEYAGFTMEHNFEKKLLNLLPPMRKLNVRQFWNIKAVWGDLSAANKKLNCKNYGNNYSINSLQGKPYVELGTGLDNIFTYFRVDCVWRFAPADNQPPRRQYNPTSHFGVFGSFHIQF